MTPVASIYIMPGERLAVLKAHDCPRIAPAAVEKSKFDFGDFDGAFHLTAKDVVKVIRPVDSGRYVLTELQTTSGRVAELNTLLLVDIRQVTSIPTQAA